MLSMLCQVFMFIFYPTLTLCRSASVVLAAVNTTLAKYSASHVTVVGHSLGTYIRDLYIGDAVVCTDVFLICRWSDWASFFILPVPSPPGVHYVQNGFIWDA